MKNLRLIVFSILLSFSSTLLSQSNWMHYSSSDGLASDTIHKVMIEDEFNIWIATENGLSHFDGNTFTNYTSQNSQLAANKITDLEWAQNKLWLLTSAGLSSFDGVSFQNYTTANGLLSNNLKDITSTSNGTVWAASLNGVVRYDGTQFIYDSSKVAYAIEADTNDFVYILTRSVVANATFSVYEVFDGTNWSSPSTNNFAGVYQPKLFKSETGQLFLIGRNQARYAKLEYPFNLTEVSLKSEPYTFAFVNPTSFHKTGDKIYISNLNDEFFLNTTVDSVLNPIIINELNSTTTAAKAKSIDVYNKDVLAVGTYYDGFLLGNATIESIDRSLSFEVNQIRTTVYDHGPLFNNRFGNFPNFEFPKDSNSHGIFAADFIVVIKEESQPNLQINALNPYLKNNNPGPISDAAGYNRSFMAKVSQQEINQHKGNFSQSSYSMPQGIVNWPANGDSTVNMAADLAPFFDANNNGCYDPENGDYPIIKGDEAVYWINHASDPSLPLEYHYMLYGFYKPTDADINQTVFLQYRVINRGNVNYDSVNVGLFMDADLGFPIDDYVGCDSLHNIAYAYNGDSFDETLFPFNNGYGYNPPALGVKFLSDSMTNFVYYNNGTGPNGDPSSVQDWNNFLNSRWKNGVPIKYGGNGYNSIDVTNQTTNYFFSGTPFPQNGWTESNPGPNENANAPNDRRFVASIPYFSLNQGASKTIEVAIGYGRKINSANQIGENVPEMVRVLNHAKAIWDTISQPVITYGLNSNCLANPVGVEEVNSKPTSSTIFPNPTSGEVYIQSDIAIQAIEVYNINGQLLRSEMIQNSTNVNLDFSNLNNGLYFIRLQDATQQWQMKKVMIVR